MLLPPKGDISKELYRGHYQRVKTAEFIVLDIKEKYVIINSSMCFLLQVKESRFIRVCGTLDRQEKKS
jgi:predicted protein tyrosine phosphatase